MTAGRSVSGLVASKRRLKRPPLGAHFPVRNFAYSERLFSPTRPRHRPTRITAGSPKFGRVNSDEFVDQILIKVPLRFRPPYLSDPIVVVAHPRVPGAQQ